MVFEEDWIKEKEKEIEKEMRKEAVRQILSKIADEVYAEESLTYLEYKEVIPRFTRFLEEYLEEVIQERVKERMRREIMKAMSEDTYNRFKGALKRHINMTREMQMGKLLKEGL